MTLHTKITLSAVSVSIVAFAACAAEPDITTPIDDDVVDELDDGIDLDTDVSAALGPLPGTPQWPIAGKTNGDFETKDFSQWSKIQRVSDDRIRIDSTPRAQGRYSARFEVHYGDDPINSSGNRAELALLAYEREGDERWYEWSTLFSASWPKLDNFAIFTQFHPNVSKAIPVIAFDASHDKVRMMTGTGYPNGGTTRWSAPLERSRWYTFRLHVKWSADPNVGFVEMWVDGKQVVQKTPVQTLVRGSTGAVPKQGIYKSEQPDDPVALLWHDGFRRHVVP